MYMELTNALTAATTPIVKAIFLTMAAMHSENNKKEGETNISNSTTNIRINEKGKWICCSDDGIILETIINSEGWRLLRESHSTPSTIEVHYCLREKDNQNNKVIKVKWVPMDNTHFVMILQEVTTSSISHKPVSISLCTEEEPLLSVMHEVNEWTREVVEAAITKLQPTLYNYINQSEIHLHDKSGITTTNNNSNTSIPLQEKQTSDSNPQTSINNNVEPPLAPSLPLPLPSSFSSPIINNSTPSLFAGVTPRPPGFRYGEGDLIPGGSLTPGGGMQLNPNAFHNIGSEGNARYYPMFPGDTQGRGRGGGGRNLLPNAGQLFPGEPDNDLLPPPGGPGFGLGFGPTRFGGGGGNIGGVGGGGGFSPFI